MTDGPIHPIHPGPAGYAGPAGGLPPQTGLTTDTAVFTTAYAVIPRSTMRDIVTSFLPGWTGMRMWMIARPLTGFAETFSQYVVELAPGGGSDTPEDDPQVQSALFVTQGEIELTLAGAVHRLGPGGFAYVPPGARWSLCCPAAGAEAHRDQGNRARGSATPGHGAPNDAGRDDRSAAPGDGARGDDTQGSGPQADGSHADERHGDGPQADGPQRDGPQGDGPEGMGGQDDGTPAVFHWFRKRWQPAAGVEPPEPFVAREQDIAPTAMPGTNGAWATTRFVDPADLRHDMHVTIVTFEPGGSIPFAETHVMEHGLYVLEGKAVYRLNRDWVEVGPGDFMWLRAFCPQACYAGGPGRFRYLLYKDVNRHAPLWPAERGTGR